MLVNEFVEIARCYAVSICDVADIILCGVVGDARHDPCDFLQLSFFFRRAQQFSGKKAIQNCDPFDGLTRFQQPVVQMCDIAS